MSSAAVLLVDASRHADAERLARVLRFFGVESQRASVADFVDATAQGGARVLCSAAAFTQLAAAINYDAAVAVAWTENVASAFVFAGADRATLAQAAAALTSSDTVAIREVGAGAEWSVTAKLPQICRSLSGVNLAVEGGGCALDLDDLRGSDAIIATSRASAFSRLSFRSVPVYLSAGGIIDIDAPLGGRWFDIRQHLVDAAPIVLYVRAAFERQVWTTSETRACLVIDDPLLKRRYGFVKFARLVSAMRRTDFATSVAFIPWNWRRSGQNTVRLFRAHPDRLSLSIHGCDHTGREFGGARRDWLTWKACHAAERMVRHETRTGIVHDRVMVFPQGVFSVTAMNVLKRGPFVGVVNTEVTSTDPITPPITIADYWGVAVMRYGEFPIYTRRYPAAGIENFAFDILLGKPCIVVVHHQDCRDDFRDVVALIERLNALNAQLHWGSLGDLIRRSYSERVMAGEFEIRLFAPVARLENTSPQPRRFRCTKQESEPDAIAEIHSGGTPLCFARHKDRIEFEVTLPSGTHTDLEIAFNSPAAVAATTGGDLCYKAKTLVRRQLCELRDSYIIGCMPALARAPRRYSPRARNSP
jgi:hypothetical protein